MTPRPEDPSKGKLTRAYSQAGPYITMGTQFAASILLGLLGGWWADGKLSTFPVFLMLGTFLGAGAGFYNLYKVLMAEEKARKEEREERESCGKA